ncbi:MAG: DUF349 domain-containing protein [Psychroserpens sp.]|uniref:DUF349 domain-containing protein n=1 Tax=Psychroserpens sp. TaxID=2020870 RepID=UPI003CA20064
MSENDNLQDADGNKELNPKKIKPSTNDSSGSNSEELEKPTPADIQFMQPADQIIEKATDRSEDAEITSEEKMETSASKSDEETPNQEKENTPETADIETEPISEEKIERDDDSNDDAIETPKNNLENTGATHVDEIDEANAEDAEDEENAERHTLETKAYDAMSMEQLTIEFEALIANHKIQNIKSQVEDIKSEFNSKFDALLDEKKEEFLSEGGNEIDFYYASPVKKRFSTAFKSYRNALNAYYKQRENNLQANLDNRLKIIEEIKGLVDTEENINTTYKQFKDLQEQWRNAGPIPRDRYNNAWNSYHHHVEIFYDVLHLNRDLRDMDFKHNLEQKTKIIERAEELAKDDNINRAFRELQVLHKLWKEDLGPVGREHRDAIWERFSNATKTIHDKRQEYYLDLDKARETNLIKKEEIISKIDEIAKDTSSSHQAWQKKIKAIETLRESFFNAGKVPKRNSDQTWSKFKGAVRAFNRNKNAYYKDLKKDQYENLEKKRALIKVALEHKDSDDFAATTPLMKKIQSDWKKIGHVPRRDSDKIWKEFKGACNAYFDRINAQRDEADKELMVAYEQKNAMLENIKAIELTGNPDQDIAMIKENIVAWKAIGHVPQNKRYIDGKFNKALDALFGKLDMDKSKLEMIKFENKLENLSASNDTRLLDNEQNFIRKKITEIKGDIIQLENNMQFFSNVDEKNPLVRDVIKNINKQKEELVVLQDKLRKVKKMY